MDQFNVVKFAIEIQKMQQTLNIEFSAESLLALLLANGVTLEQISDAAHEHTFKGYPEEKILWPLFHLVIHALFQGQ